MSLHLQSSQWVGVYKNGLYVLVTEVALFNFDNMTIFLHD